MKKILIVDDETNFLLSLADMLKVSNNNFSVETAGNGIEASKIIDSGGIDLVVTDLNMPVMNGLELLKALRELPVTKRTPVLMLTTETKDELKQQGKALGLTGWIVKPFNPTQLKSAITRVLRLPA